MNELERIVLICVFGPFIGIAALTLLGIVMAVIVDFYGNWQNKQQSRMRRK